MKPLDFLESISVFTVDEYARFLESAERGHGPRAQEASLSYHLRAGRIARIRRGLYAVVPRGSSVDNFTVDPFVVASKLTDDAVISHHSALSFYGKAYSVRNLFTVITEHKPIKFNFQDYLFQTVRTPKALIEQEQQGWGVKIHIRDGLSINVTSYERTMVDMLSNPKLSGGWEEIWQSLEFVEYFDLDKIVEYVSMLDKAITAALVGFFLEQHQDTFNVKEYVLNQLEAKRPKSPCYLERDRREPAKLVGRWNLMVPVSVINRTWDDLL